MSWALRATAEAVEQTEGEAVGSRNEALRSLRNRHGVGPPDLMWLRKTTPGEPPTGFYHWVLGQEVSSAASIAAYFAELCESVEKPGLLAGLWGSQVYKVVAGEFRCYDAFSRSDLRCSLACPGGVAASVVGADGATVPATQEVWVGAWVSSFLRCELLDLQTISSALGSFKRMESLPSADVEEQFLECVEAIYRNEEMRSRIDELHSDVGKGTRAEEWDVLSAAVYQHFRRRQRIEQACDFFSGLVEWHTEAAVYAALAEHELDLFSEALKTLEGAVQQCPQSVPLNVALGQRLLEVGQVSRALSLARAALKLDESARCAWLLLANAYSAGEAYALSLIAANLTPAPPPFPDSKDMLGVLPPPSYDITLPREKQYDAEVEEVMVKQEEANADGADELFDLAGGVLLPDDPHLASGLHLDICQHRAATSVHAAVYGVIVDVVDAVGWDAFLRERSHAFLMSDELTSSSGGNGSVSDGEGSDEEEDAVPLESKGQRTPTPAMLTPAAAPPPNGSAVRTSTIADASTVSPMRTTQRQDSDQVQPVGVNPLLWSAVYGGAAKENVATLQRMSLSDSAPARAQPSAPSKSSSNISSDSSSALDTDDDDYDSSDSREDDEDMRELALQADRAWMIEGDLQELLSHRRLCVSWVDELITAVFKDLTEYTSWMLLDRRLRRAGRPGQASSALGQAEAEEGNRHRSDDEEDEDIDDIPVPILLPVDWMRRGLMCIRLKKLHDAERALRVATHQEFSMTCYQAMFQIYAGQGMMVEGLDAVLEVAEFHCKRHKTSGSPSELRPSATAVWMVSSLVMVRGLQAVRDAYAIKAGSVSDGVDDLMNSLFHQSVAWQSDGFDA